MAMNSGAASPLAPFRKRRPAVLAVACFAGGILLDRWLDLPLVAWLVVGLLFAVAVVVARRLRVGTQASILVVALLLAAAGAARHHVEWSIRGADNVRTLCNGPPTPVTLTGRLASATLIEPADPTGLKPSWMLRDRTVATVDCESVADRGPDVAATGRVRVVVDGHWIGPQVGDRLALTGQLALPRPPMNPGDFDYANWLRLQQIDVTLKLDHPDHARMLVPADSVWDSFINLRDRLRDECEWLLIQHVDSARVPVAVSLLLGDRSGLTQELEADFAASGTMHILAISGLHVAILAGLVHIFCRMLKLGSSATAVTLLVMVLGYTLLTDQRPPVMRAALLVVIVLAGLRAGRQSGGYQLLALCAFLLLLLHPLDLFDIGAQLSFLAVAAIIWSNRVWIQSDDDPVLPLIDVRSRPWWQRALEWLQRGIRQGLIVTSAIWLTTIPLGLLHFHQVSPIGLVVNIALAPVVLVMLAAGYVLLFAGLLIPPLAFLPAWVFDTLLSFLLMIVDWSGSTPLGHFSQPAPPVWWIVGGYLLWLGCMNVIPLPGTRVRQVQGLIVWTAIGLCTGLVPRGEQPLRLTFLSVGHGCAVLIETPDDGVLLYDAGSFADGGRALQTIQSALFERGQRRLDALIISHADVDHYNGAQGLVGQIPVGTILCSKLFLDFQQVPVRQLCDAAAETGVPLRIVQAGDQLASDSDVSLRVLHPPGAFVDEEDNPGSVVLDIQYAGRRVLLTGDLEGAGLDHLLAMPSAPVDILMSPHHGSAAANPTKLFTHFHPGHVVITSGDADALPLVRDRVQAGTMCWSTANHGAVTCEVTASGNLRVTPYLP
jgi:competence protein ComEC